MNEQRTGRTQQAATEGKASELTARWEALVAEGEATTQELSHEAEGELSGWTDYALDNWEGNEDLAATEGEWYAVWRRANELWLERHPADPDWDGE